jgi:hypothetical protein
VVTASSLVVFTQVCKKVLADLKPKLEGKKTLEDIEGVIGKYCEKPPGEKEGKLVSQRQRCLMSFAYTLPCFHPDCSATT